MPCSSCPGRCGQSPNRKGRAGTTKLAKEKLTENVFGRFPALPCDLLRPSPRPLRLKACRRVPSRCHDHAPGPGSLFSSSKIEASRGSPPENPHHPDRARRVSLQECRGPGYLCREGQKPAQPGCVLLP